MNFHKRNEVLAVVVKSLLSHETAIVSGTGFFFEVLVSFLSDSLYELFPEDTFSISIAGDSILRFELYGGGTFFMFDPTVDILLDQFLNDYSNPETRGLDLFLLLESPENSLKDLYNDSLLPVLLMREESRTKVVRI